jgi:hypothetical protein
VSEIVWDWWGKWSVWDLDQNLICKISKLAEGPQNLMKRTQNWLKDLKIG